MDILALEICFWWCRQRQIGWTRQVLIKCLWITRWPFWGAVSRSKKPVELVDVWEASESTKCSFWFWWAKNYSGDISVNAPGVWMKALHQQLPRPQDSGAQTQNIDGDRDSHWSTAIAIVLNLPESEIVRAITCDLIVHPWAIGALIAPIRVQTWLHQWAHVVAVLECGWFV